MPHTEDAKHLVTVKESATGKPWFMFELVDGEEISSLRNISIGIRLKDGTTYEQARDLASRINQHAIGLTATMF